MRTSGAGLKRGKSLAASRKPAEHTALFAGNNDDHFRMGIKLTRSDPIPPAPHAPLSGEEKGGGARSAASIAPPQANAHCPTAPSVSILRRSAWAICWYVEETSNGSVPRFLLSDGGHLFAEWICFP